MWLRILLIFCLWVSIASAASVQWDASVVDAEHGAPDGYRVYYGLSSDGLGTVYDNGLGLQFAIPDEWPAGEYYFGVRAYNQSGESDWATTPEGQPWVSYTKADPPPVLPPAPATDVQIVWERLMADTTLYTNALAVYDFENNANDTKGARNLTGSGLSYSTTGEAQGTYWLGELAGSGVASRSDSAFRFTGDYSISFWCQSQYMSFGVGPAIGTQDGTNGWSVTVYNQNLRVVHLTNGTARTSTFTGYTFANDTRYHIVVAYSDSADTVTAWVSTTSFGNCLNGTTVAQTYNPTAGTTEAIEVNWDDNYGFYDEVVLWGSAITSTDASAIFGARDGGTSWRETGGGSSAVPKIMLLQDHFSGGIH